MDASICICIGHLPPSSLQPTPNPKASAYLAQRKTLSLSHESNHSIVPSETATATAKPPPALTHTRPSSLSSLYSSPVQSMRRLEVAALALLVAGAAAAALVVLLAVCHGRRHRRGSKRPGAPELPLSTPLPQGGRHHHDHLALALLLLLCSGRRRRLRARVEPAAAPPGSRTTTTDPPSPAAAAADGVSSSSTAVLEDEVAAWRERWFGGPVSRALYTIYEERDDEDEEEEAAGAGAGGEQETETPFYTPPASPQGDGGTNGALEYAVPIQLIAH